MSRGPLDPLPLEPGKRLDDDVDLELQHHLELRAAELVEQGWDPAAARAEALRAFGDVGTVRDECRDVEQERRRAVRRADAWTAFWHDLVVGARVLRRSPGFTLAAVLTLALGIGANTAIFSVVNAVLLRPLPYAEPDRLVDIAERHERGWGNVPWANFTDVREYTRSFAALASYGAGEVTVLGAAQPLRLQGAAVSADFFRVMGVRPLLGRLPTPDEHRPGAAPVALVSDRFWRRHLGARAELAGTRLRTSWDAEVIGVLPAGFFFPGDVDVWIPLELDRQPPSRTSHNWSVVGRLRPGVSPADAERDVARLFERLRPLYTPDFDAVGAIVTPLQANLTGPLRRPLFILLGASAVLLLAACTNLASAVLARGTARAQEFAVRAALGAGRVRLVRHFFAENILLAAMGCAAGVGFAWGAVRALAAVAPASLRVDAVTLDGWVLAFAALVASVTAVLFGLFPALRVTDAGVAQAMRDGAKGSAGPRRRRLWSILVGAEVGLAVLLLAGSALLIRSFAAVMRTDPGFRAAGVLTVEVNLPDTEYPETGRAALFHDRALAAIAALPGVRRAGATNVLPLTGNNPSGAIEIEGEPFNFERFRSAVYRLASPDYFRAMGIPLVRGRWLEAGDHGLAPQVVVVNEAFAEAQWPGQDPIGKRFRPAGMDMGARDLPGGGMANLESWATVIGVVGNVRHAALTDGTLPAYYYDYRQRTRRIRYMTYAIEAAAPLESLREPVRRAVAGVDPNVPLEFGDLQGHVGAAVADRRFTMIVLGAFAAVALVLASVGIYGVVAYAVAQRTREIGIRLALGAEPGAVRRMVQGDALRVVGAGLVAGTVAAVLATRLLRALLYDVSPSDPMAFAAAVGLLGVAAFVASWIPARRATQVDPMVAIRAD